MILLVLLKISMKALGRDHCEILEVLGSLEDLWFCKTKHDRGITLTKFKIAYYSEYFTD